MATGAPQHYKAKIDFRRRGNVPAPRFRLAVREALREVAQPLLRRTRELAAGRVKNSPSRTNRGGRRHAEQMVDRYEVDVLSDGKTLSLRNPLLRGRIFELGSKGHPITAKRGGFLYFRATNSGPGYSTGDLIRRRSVRHPGTQAQYPMRDAMRGVKPLMTRNLKDAINSELKGRG